MPELPEVETVVRELIRNRFSGGTGTRPLEPV